MYKPLRTSKRISRPMHAAGIVNGILRAMGGGASDADLANRWREIVGDDIADMCDLVSLSRPKKVRMPNGEIKNAGARTITVKAKNPALATLLSYRGEEIKKTINSYFGSDEFAKVVIRK